MSVSKQLIHLRKLKGVSQEELAAMMNVTRQSVSKWETEASWPDSEKIMQLSEVFGVSTDYLLKGKEGDSTVLSTKQKSQAGKDMSVEVNKILNTVHTMQPLKRYMMGLGVAASLASITIGIVFLIIQ